MTPTILPVCVAQRLDRLAEVAPLLAAEGEVHFIVECSRPPRRTRLFAFISNAASSAGMYCSSVFRGQSLRRSGL